MFPLIRKNLSFLRCSSLSLQVRTLLIRSPVPVREFSPSSSPSPRQPDTNCSCQVPVRAWWDVDNCGLPSGVSFLKVAPAIMAAVRANGIYGRIDIRAFGDFRSVDKDEFLLSGMRLFPISGGNNNAYECLFMDLNYWVFKNPPPAHLFLILGDRDDRDFSDILHRLRMKNYNILIASSGRESDVLCNATTIMWQWSSILKGKDFAGKHFNYPPIGSINSWYGHSKVPLENPFSAVEDHTSPQNTKIHEPSSNIKLGEVPKLVSSQVRKILSSYPNGISIVDLRAELTKCDMPLGKEGFNGHENFSNFLASIPHVQLEYLGEGDFCVRLIPSLTYAQQRDGTSMYVSSVGDEKKSFQSIPSQGKPIGEYVDGKSSFLVPC